jgi:prepilin-type N-terminal cleavage/methylation domain-containing protein
MKRLKGFTLMELLVVLGVSGLIITAALFLLFNFKGFLGVQMTDRTDQEKVIEYFTILQNDFQNSSICKRVTTTSLEMVKEESKVYYYFKPNLIIRNEENLKDSLKVESLKMKSHLQFKNQNLVDSLHLEFEYQSTALHWKLGRRYYSTHKN